MKVLLKKVSIAYTTNAWFNCQIVHVCMKHGQNEFISSQRDRKVARLVPPPPPSVNSGSIYQVALTFCAYDDVSDGSRPPCCYFVKFSWILLTFTLSDLLNMFVIFISHSSDVHNCFVTPLGDRNMSAFFVKQLFLCLLSVYYSSYWCMGRGIKWRHVTI